MDSVIVGKVFILGLPETNVGIRISKYFNSYQEFLNIRGSTFKTFYCIMIAKILGISSQKKIFSKNLENYKIFRKKNIIDSQMPYGKVEIYHNLLLANKACLQRLRWRVWVYNLITFGHKRNCALLIYDLLEHYKNHLDFLKSSEKSIKGTQIKYRVFHRKSFGFMTYGL